MQESLKLFKESELDAPQSDNHFDIIYHTEWIILCCNGDYHHTFKEDLRLILLIMLETDRPRIRIDMKSIDTVDLSYINALMSFSEKHRALFSNGILEIININIKTLNVFNLVKMSEHYTLSKNGGN